MSLFQLGPVTLASGEQSSWKIECDALTKDDWKALAAIAVERLPSFGGVAGIPCGGLPFARELEHYITSGPLLICDDVWTTGGSMKKFIDSSAEARLLKAVFPTDIVIGVVAFARFKPEPWVTALFQCDRVRA